MKKKIFVIGLACILLIMSLGTVAGRVEVEASNQSSTSEELPDFEVLSIENIRFDLWWGTPWAGMPRILYSIVLQNNGADYDGQVYGEIFIDDEPKLDYKIEGPWKSKEIKSFDDYCRWPDKNNEHTISFVIDYSRYAPLEDYKSGEAQGEVEESDETNNWISKETKFSRARNSYVVNPAIASLLQRLVSNFPLLQRLINL